MYDPHDPYRDVSYVTENAAYDASYAMDQIRMAAASIEQLIRSVAKDKDCPFSKSEIEDLLGAAEAAREHFLSDTQSIYEERENIVEEYEQCSGWAIRP